MAIVPFRDQLLAIVPRWLRGHIGSRILYALGLHFDLLADAAVAAVQRRFPIAGESDDAMWLMSRDRRVPRGPNEPASAFAPRLQQWWDTTKTAGGPYGMLEQLTTYWAHADNAPTAVALVYASGTQITLDDREMTPWSPPLTPTGTWARWWLFVHYDSPIGSVDDPWGADSTSWGDDSVWGSDLSAAFVDRIRVVPREWNAAHTKGRIGLSNPGTELWGYPAGDWGDDGVWGSVEVLWIAV